MTSASFVLFGQPNSCGHCRLGITVTKKTGGAIRRNRIKRVLRDIFRRKQADLMPAMDLVVNARPKVVDRDAKALEEEFLRSFARLTRRTGR